jgi:hypothetical protein
MSREGRDRGSGEVLCLPGLENGLARDSLQGGGVLMSGDLTLTQEFVYTKMEVKEALAIFYAPCFNTGSKKRRAFRIAHISGVDHEERFLKLTNATYL